MAPLRGWTLEKPLLGRCGGIRVVRLQPSIPTTPGDTNLVADDDTVALDTPLYRLETDIRPLTERRSPPA
jgi:hypothetical protein